MLQLALPRWARAAGERDLGQRHSGSKLCLLKCHNTDTIDSNSYTAAASWSSRKSLLLSKFLRLIWAEIWDPKTNYTSGHQHFWNCPSLTVSAVKNSLSSSHKLFQTLGSLATLEWKCCICYFTSRHSRSWSSRHSCNWIMLPKVCILI